MKRFVLLTLLYSTFHSLNANGQVFSWAQGFNSTGSSSAATGIGSIAFNQNNNVYITGVVTGTVDVDQSSSTYNLASVGSRNMFLLKEDAAGNFIWAKLFAGISPGSWGLWANAIDFDASGNIYIAGTIRDSFDMDPGPGVYTFSTGGAQVAFILKLDSFGNFIWAKKHEVSVPVNNTSGVTGIKIVGDVLYMASGFAGTVDINPGAGVFNVTSTPGVGTDMLLIKMDTAGNFIWGKQIGGTGIDNVTSLATDSIANLYITGGFQNSVDFNPSTAVNSLTSGGNYDVFVAKYDSAGNYLWAKGVGSGSRDFGWNLSLDQFGNVFTTGSFGGTVDFDPGPGVYNLTSNSTRSIFTLRLRNDGEFSWARMAGAPVGLFEARAVTTDSLGNVYTAAGLPGSCDMDPGPGVYTVPAGVAVQKLDSSGNFVWARSWGADIPGWIGLDHDNSVYVTGTFSGFNKDFDPGPDVFLLSGSSQGSGFIQKLCQSQNTITLTASAPSACVGDTIVLTAPVIAGGSYRWKRNGTVLPDTTSTISVTTSGVYELRIDGSCPLLGSVGVTFFPHGNPTISLPAGPLIVASGQTVTIPATLNNVGLGWIILWYKNGQLFDTTATATLDYIKGAGADTIVAVIRAVVDNPCYKRDTSNAVVVDEWLGVDELSAHGIRVFPNPTSGTIHFTAPQPIDRITITDVTGKTVYTSTPRSREASANLSGQAAGVYFYRLDIQERTLRGKVLVTGNP